MGQGPIATQAFGKAPDNSTKPLLVDANGNLMVATTDEEATVQTHLNITAATVVKAAPGKVLNVTVVVAGAAGTVNDCTTTGAAAAANQIATTPAVVGTQNLNGFPCAAGIVVVPGAGQTVAISFE